MNWEIRYLYRGRPGYMEVTAPNRIAALRQGRNRVKTILSCRRLFG
jgi:hypothetical protein